MVRSWGLLWSWAGLTLLRFRCLVQSSSAREPTRARLPRAAARGRASTSKSTLDDIDFEVEEEYDLDDDGWNVPNPNNDEHWRAKKDVWDL